LRRSAVAQLGRCHAHEGKETDNIDSCHFGFVFIVFNDVYDEMAASR